MSSKESNYYGYTLRDRYGRVVYIGTTNNPRARRAEHQLDKKEFHELKTERRGMTKAQADKWEREWLSGYRGRHGGRNPRYNRTLDGQPGGERYEGSGESKSRISRTSRGAQRPSRRRAKEVAIQVAIKVAIPEVGYCLRCGTGVPFDPERPYCEMHYRSWRRFKNAEYEEEHCHACGEEHVTSMAMPMCLPCYRKNRESVKVS